MKTIQITPFYIIIPHFSRKSNNYSEFILTIYKIYFEICINEEDAWWC